MEEKTSLSARRTKLFQDEWPAAGQMERSYQSRGSLQSGREKALFKGQLKWTQSELERAGWRIALAIHKALKQLANKEQFQVVFQVKMEYIAYCQVFLMKYKVITIIGNTLQSGYTNML